jgi:hypothetical protein
MTRADRVLSTPPTNTSDPIYYEAPFRAYLVEGFAIALILILGSMSGCLIAHQASGKIAHRCAADLQRAPQ